MNYFGNKNPSTNYNYFYFKSINNSDIKRLDYKIYLRRIWQTRAIINMVLIVLTC